MNAQKFTQKSLEAIQEAQNIALEHNSMQIEQEHLVCALLEQKDGLIPQLMKKMGTDPDALLHAVEQRIEGLARGYRSRTGKAGRSMCPATWIKIWPPLSGKPAG